jgi:hypothetical protein
MDNPDDWCDWCGEKIASRRRLDGQVFCSLRCLDNSRRGDSTRGDNTVTDLAARRDGPHKLA